jgi:hypothetical protein
MSRIKLNLEVLTGEFAVCQLEPEAKIPNWALQGDYYALTKTKEELSLVCLQSTVPSNVKSEGDWRVIKVLGPLDFALVGILASLSTTLMKASVSIFAISTFDTDYLLVKKKDLAKACEALKQADYNIINY